MPNQIKDILQEVPVGLPAMKYVPTWRDEIPADSLWTPGSHGHPGCKTCRGTGWMRADVYPGHPQFGKLMPCDCVKDLSIRRRLDYERSPDYKPVPKTATP